MKLVLLLLLVLAVGAAAATWSLRRRADELCHSAHVLADQAPKVSAWLREAAGDPYLGASALRGPPNGVIALYRERSRALADDVSARVLPPATVEAYRRLGTMRSGDPRLAGALEALRPAVAGLVCRAPASSTAEADDLEKELDAAELFWGEQRAVSKIARQEFARDQSIFCHGEDLLKKLRVVVEAAAEKCRGAKPGSKLARSCAAKKVSGASSVEAEIQDLEKQRELNLRKLRQKWPEAVVAGLAC